MPDNEPNIIAPNKPDDSKMLKLSNDLLEIERKINRLEHDRINILGYDDPVLNDGELLRLNMLGKEIWDLKNEHKKKATELYDMKKAYYKGIFA